MTHKVIQSGRPQGHLRNQGNSTQTPYIVFWGQGLVAVHSALTRGKGRAQ